MPEGAQSAAPSRRPTYLWIALVTLSLIGMSTAGEGLNAISAARNPIPPPTLVAPDFNEALRSAVLQAMSTHVRINLPIGVAQLLLGSLLLFVATRALFGRRVSPSLALQVIAANAGLLVVGYVLRQPLRETVVNDVLAAGIEEHFEGLSAEQLELLQRGKIWWSFRIGLALELGAFALSALALSRRTAREFLAAEPAEDPDT